MSMDATDRKLLAWELRDEIARPLLMGLWLLERGDSTPLEDRSYEDLRSEELRAREFADRCLMYAKDPEL